MEIEFASTELLGYYAGTYSGKAQFSEDIIKEYKEKLEHMISARSIAELSGIRSLHIEKYEDRWSARINRQFRIEFSFRKPDVITILRISKHYE